MKKSPIARGKSSGDKQDRLVSIRLPSNLLADIDQIAAAKGIGRSELIREAVSGVLLISTGDFDAEQLLQLQVAFVTFFQWFNDPLESLLDILSAISKIVESPQFQEKFTMLLADVVVRLGDLMGEIVSEVTLHPAPTTDLVKELARKRAAAFAEGSMIRIPKLGYGFDRPVTYKE